MMNLTSFAGTTRMIPRTIAGLLGVAVCGVTVLISAAPPDSPVADAARGGDATRVRTLLREGADVNGAHGDGMSALHWAAERGDADLAGMLIYAGANVGSVTRIGSYTPLHVASRAGSADVVRVLLDSGTDVDVTTTTSGSTALHLAAASGTAAAVAALLEYGADPNALEKAWGQTPLIFAASQNRVEAIVMLLEHGADAAITANIRDVVKWGLVNREARNRQRKVIDSFNLADEEVPSPSQVRAAVRATREIYQSGKLPKPQEARDPRPPTIDSMGGLTALLHAARQGYTESAIALLDGGADINQVGAGDATSPLLMAVINGQFDLATTLLERGADPNLAASINGVTPLWAAVNAQWQPRTRFPQPQQHDQQEATYLTVMEALLDAGADPDARLTRHPWYMVYSGCGNRNCGLVETEGSTAFWRAAYATDVEAMTLLVDRGADPNIPTIAPPPRRHRGGTFGKEAKGALPPIPPGGPGLWAPTVPDPKDRPDPSGMPAYLAGGPGVFPIHAASGVGYGEGFAGNAHRHAPDAWMSAVEYLVGIGADVNERDHNGFNVIHHAAARGDNEMILYLVDQGADVTAVSRRGQTTADLANGPVQRVSPFPETVALLERLGSKNNHNCVSC